jgi:hypothetical protein
MLVLQVTELNDQHKPTVITLNSHKVFKGYDDEELWSYLNQKVAELIENNKPKVRNLVDFKDESPELQPPHNPNITKINIDNEVWELELVKEEIIDIGIKKSSKRGRPKGSKGKNKKQLHIESYDSE